MAADSAARPETLTVVLSEPVEFAHVLNPTNDSERLLFRHFLETLIRIDCQGSVRPGLAQSWSGDSGGRVWTLTLREGGLFPGGTSIDALRVAMLLAGPEGKAAGIDSAVQLDDRRVRIRLHKARDIIPGVLAEPALALLDGLASADSGSIRWFDIPPRDGRPFIRFQIAQNGDPRDAIDRGVNLAVTRDPSVVEYVASRPEYVTYPLPWSRTYVLLQPAGARQIDGASGSDSLRRSLARDAVRAEARPAERPLWSDSATACVAASPAEGRVPTTARVVYLRGDEVARGLAERIVALSGDTQLRAAPLATPDFTVALQRGAERAFVLSVPRQTMDPCRAAAGWPPTARVQPLIDTRARAIIRRGSPPLTVDWDGTVRVESDAAAGKGAP